MTFTRPHRKNAIPDDGWQQLVAAFVAFEASEARVLVMAGEGGDFSSGADLAADGGDLSSTVSNYARMQNVSDAATRLHRLPKPTIAIVDGAAVGAGMNLAIGCDLVIATERARFAEVFARRGLGLDTGGTWLLPRLVGERRARELALTGRFVHADEALAIGLVTEVVSSDQLDAAVQRHIDALLAAAPMAQRFIKVGLDRATSMTFEQALAWEAQSQAVLLASGDFAEGLAAFRERREPRFKGS